MAKLVRVGGIALVRLRPWGLGSARSALGLAPIVIISTELMQEQGKPVMMN